MAVLQRGLPPAVLGGTQIKAAAWTWYVTLFVFKFDGSVTVGTKTNKKNFCLWGFLKEVIIRIHIGYMKQFRRICFFFIYIGADPEYV